MLNRGVTAPYKWVEKLFSDKDATETPESIPEPWLVSFGAVENAFPDRFKKFEKVDSDYLSRQLFETDKAVVRDQVVKAFGKPSWVRLAGTQSSQFLVRYRKLTGLTEHAPERDSTSPANIPDLAANDHRDYTNGH